MQRLSNIYNTCMYIHKFLLYFGFFDVFVIFIILFHFYIFFHNVFMIFIEENDLQSMSDDGK